MKAISSINLLRKSAIRQLSPPVLIVLLRERSSHYNHVIDVIIELIEQAQLLSSVGIQSLSMLS